MVMRRIDVILADVIEALGIDAGGHVGATNEGAGPAQGGANRPSVSGEEEAPEWKGKSAEAEAPAKFYRANTVGRCQILAFPPTIGRDMAVAPHELPRSATVISMLKWKQARAHLRASKIAAATVAAIQPMKNQYDFGSHDSAASRAETYKAITAAAVIQTLMHPPADR